LVFGILGSFVTKNLSVLDKMDYFESTFWTPAYLFFISLLSASFLFFTNQPVPIVDQDGVISISARIQECDKNLSLRFVLDKLNNNLTLPAILILKDSIVQMPKSFDLITNYFMAYEDIVQNKLKAIENQQNTRSRQIQIIGSWKIIINEKEKIEETLQSLRDFNSIPNRPLNQQEISIISKNSINGVLSDLQKVKSSFENFEHEVLIKKQMNLFKTNLIETDLWSKNSEDKIISYKK
jgi:hypothetical protein